MRLRYSARTADRLSSPKRRTSSSQSSRMSLALQLLFLKASESMGNHDSESWARAASIEETLALWAASLREVKQRIRPLFTQERVRRMRGLFSEGLLGDEQRKTG